MDKSFTIYLIYVHELNDILERTAELDLKSIKATDATATASAANKTWILNMDNSADIFYLAFR